MTKRKNRRQWIVTVVILVVIAVVAGVAFWLTQNKNTEEPAPEEVPVVEPVVAPVEEPDMSEEESAEVVEKPEVPQYDGSNPNAGATLTGVISYVGFDENIVRIRVNIDQFLESGTCRLALTRAGQIAYEETVKIIDNVATSTCEGFDILASKLAGPSYEAVIYLTGDGKTGEIHGEVSL